MISQAEEQTAGCTRTGTTPGQALPDTDPYSLVAEPSGRCPPYPGKLRTRSTRKTTSSAARTKPHSMNVPHPAPVSAISSTGVAVAWGVTEGVPGPGVRVGTSVMVGGGVLVAGPGTGVLVLVGLGALVTDGGLVGGMGEMVTIGVTARSVGEGMAVDVLVGVSVGGGVKVDVGGVGGVAVLVGEGV